ncbi:MAG: hypothetical protein ABI652_02280 [Acidobacteriota bacterium]
MALGLCGVSSQASAVTVADLVGLKANGVGDDILIALVQTDGSVFHLSADDVLDLRARGLSEPLITAMIRTGGTASTAPASPAPTLPASTDSDVRNRTVINIKQTIVQEAAERTVVVGVPVYVPVNRHPSPPPPIYWGFGGQRRPDTWQPSRDDHAPPPTRTPPASKSDNATGSATRDLTKLDAAKPR